MCMFMSVQFDNILMEEAAQILEIETFIPLLLQVGAQYPPPPTPHQSSTQLWHLPTILSHSKPSTQSVSHDTLCSTT